MENKFAQMKQSFENYEEEELLDNIKAALDEGAEPVDIVALLSRTLEGIGEQFSKGELFLPDMVLAGDQMGMCMDILQPALEKSKNQIAAGAKILLGTVAGDIHDIGKNMVKTMLSVSGFTVVDLGTDVSAAQFYEAAISEKPAAVALSSCMTTTVPSMKDTIDLFKSKGLTNQLKIIVGGGSMNPSVAESFGGCIFGGHDAFEAAQIMKKILR
ncbi:MAG: cobalamin-dependent protein [Bacillota bacterium]